MRTGIKVFLIGCILFFLSCSTSQDENSSLFHFIPENATTIYSIENISNVKADIKNSSFKSSLTPTYLYQSLTQENSLLKYLQIDTTSVLAISPKEKTFNYSFTTPYNKSLFNTLDSLGVSRKESTVIKKDTIITYATKASENYVVHKDQYWVISNHKPTLLALLSKNRLDPNILSSLQKIKGPQNITHYFKSSNHPSLKQKHIGDWTSVSTNILPDAITARGVILEKDSTSGVLSLFKDNTPQQNDIGVIAPLKTKSLLAFTYSDFDLFQKQRQKLDSTNFSEDNYPQFFETITEIGQLHHQNDTLIALKSIAAENTLEAIQPQLNSISDFRNITIYEHIKPDVFSRYLNPLITSNGYTYACILDNFFVFGPSENSLKDVITAYSNKQTLNTSSYFKELQQEMTHASSLLFLNFNHTFSKELSFVFNETVAPLPPVENKNTVEVSALQFTNDTDFSHLSFTAKEIPRKRKINTGAYQIQSINIPNPIASTPQFFSNHRSKGKDILVQDTKNILYFIAANGRILWTKQLSSNILGAIKEVDIFKNGKKQLAFVTKNSMFVLDRNGANVGNFPAKFNDDITQPLSVFDYDNNRKYRFTIVQDDEILLLDTKAKRVRGFTFKKAGSAIAQPPKHFRIGSKDYIVIPEKEGKLNILNRTGKSRIKVNTRFSFTNIPITKEGNSIVVITQNDTKESINTNGKVSSRKLDITSSYWFTMLGTTKVTLDDHLLRINGKLTELPFGIYSEPTLKVVNKKLYIAVTETQENKVYVYSKTGVLQPGFPVYGTSRSELGDATNNGITNVLTKGDKSTILVYALK